MFPSSRAFASAKGKEAPAAEPAAPAPTKVRMRFDTDGRIVPLSQSNMLKRKKRTKLSIENIEDRGLLKFMPMGLKYVVIQTKRTSNMTTAGKKASMSSLVVIGNENGAAGFAFGKGSEVRTSITQAVRKAYRNMIPIKLLDNHTIHHKGMGDCRATRVFARPGRPNKGLVCHKYIALVCRLAGIKDFGADVIGRKNPLSILRATFEILGNQKTILEKAAEEKKTVLEYRDLRRPPVILSRYKPTSKDLAQTAAEKATLAWIKAFPREQTFPNFLLARQMLAGTQTQAEDTTDLATWIAAMPTTVSLQKTAFVGVPLPATVKSF